MFFSFCITIAFISVFYLRVRLLRVVNKGEYRTTQSEATFTGSRSTKELSNSLEDEHVPATTGQAVSVEEGDDEGGNERSDARTCETEDDGEDTQADVAGRVSQQRAEERGNATQHQG